MIDQLQNGPAVALLVLAGIGLFFYVEGEVRRRMRRLRSLRRLERFEWMRFVSGLRSTEDGVR
jgi:hypothetical protein